jgi:hypothetical protein
VYARQVWHGVLNICGLEAHLPNHDDALIDWWPTEQQRLHTLSRKGFDSLVLLAVWTPWKERNTRVFDHKVSSVTMVCQRINDEIELWKLSGAVGLSHIWG